MAMLLAVLVFKDFINHLVRCVVSDTKQPGWSVKIWPMLGIHVVLTTLTKDRLSALTKLGFHWHVCLMLTIIYGTDSTATAFK
jgi:hypothetical protein